jgi:hypothetical protein
VLIVAVVVIAIAVVVALVVRSKRQRQSSTTMGLPDLGALSTEGLDKEHTSSPSSEQPSTRPDKP